MAQSLREQLFNAYENDQPATVLALGTVVLKENPQDGPVLVRVGAMNAALARYDIALELLERALQVSPEEQRYLVLSHLGDLYKHRGDLVAAADYYQAATRLAPDEADNFIFLGSVLARLGRLQDAEAAHRAATACREGCIDEAYHNLGLVLRAQNRLADAQQCFEKALAIDPTNEDWQAALEDVIFAQAIAAERARE